MDLDVKPSLDIVKTLLTQKELPSHDLLFQLAERASDILEEEKTEYRAVADNNTPGSLLDFGKNSLPCIVVPDLHARPDFLLNILEYKLKGGETVYQALSQQKINLIFVGDILHTEKKTKQRWYEIAEDFKQGIIVGSSITQEMIEGLSLLCGLLQLKIFFPENCHILKGNHENILNTTGNGDFAFRKYVNEGEMCRVFLQEYYGDDILYIIHCFERVLPLVAVGANFVVSHAEPSKNLSKNEIINARLENGVIESLTWTPNDVAVEGSVKEIIENLKGDRNIEQMIYLGGHRPVNGKYELRQSGLFVQIHNPDLQNIAVLENNKKFNPETDIVEVNL